MSRLLKPVLLAAALAAALANGNLTASAQPARSSSDAITLVWGDAPTGRRFSIWGPLDLEIPFRRGTNDGIISMAVLESNAIEGTISLAGQTYSFSGAIQQSGSFKAKLVEARGHLRGKLEFKTNPITGAGQLRGSFQAWLPRRRPIRGLLDSGAIIREDAEARIEAQRRVVEPGSAPSFPRILPPTRFTPPPSN